MKIAIVFLTITIYAAVLANPDRTPDCRKFVFAPICRGVAAKRNSAIKIPQQNAVVLDGNKLRALLKTYALASELLSEESFALPSDSVPSRVIGKKPESEVTAAIFDYDHI